MMHGRTVTPYAVATRQLARSKHPRSPARPAAPAGGIGALVGSSAYRAIADDALKDEDNAGWALGLAPAVRDAWVRRIRWIRVVDRLAENERFEPEAGRFAAFRRAFRELRAGAGVAPGPHADLLSGIREAWLSSPGDASCERALIAWDDYLEALAVWTRPEVVVTTLREHDEMLFRLSGRIFQLVPFLDEARWEAAGELGRLDQLFNNLRDLEEDAANGIVYFPEEILARFGLTRREVLEGRCCETDAWRSMMRFWLDDHLATLRLRAGAFALAEGMHPSLEVMRAFTLLRHARIERVFRACDFDYRRFAERYWAEVESRST